MSARGCRDRWWDKIWSAQAPGMQTHALPGDEPQWPRDRDAVVKHTAIDVRLYPAERRITGKVTHVLTPYNDGLARVRFDAVEMDITSAAVSGKEAAFRYDGTQVEIEFPRPLNRTDEVKVTIAYATAPRIGLYFIEPDAAHPDKPWQAWTQGQDEDSKYWFPCIDAPNQKATTELKATVPGTWTVVSNGRLLDDKTNKDGTKTFHWYQDRPHATYLVTLAAGEFARIDASRPGLTIDYYVEERDREAAERTFPQTPAMVSLFEEVTGLAFPWAKYSQVVVRDFVFGGMENTSATTMTENILLDEKATRDYTSDGLISHELAHMWFGDLLTCRAWSHGWLNEGFATFMEMLWTERHRGADEYVQEALDNQEIYQSERYRRPVVANVYNEPIDVFDRHLYEKGSLVLYMLRHLLGDDRFFRSIRRYVHAHQDTNVVTQDLIDAIATETGQNLDWFFDQWVFKPGHPKLKASWSWDADRKLATVSIKQTQDQDDGTPIFRIPLGVSFKIGRGRPRTFEVELRRAEESFAFSLPSRPAFCRVDPGHRVLRELDFEKPLTELVAQLTQDDDVTGRIEAAAGLGANGSPAAIEALAAAVMKDRFWGVQAAAARALGVAGGDAGRDALLACLRVRHPRARRAVVAALGAFHGDERVFQALKGPAARDRSWFVESEANRSIGKLRVDGAFEVIEQHFRRPSFRSVVRTGCIDGLVELRDERGFALLREAVRYGEPFQARPAGATAMARLALYFAGRKKQVADELVVLLDDSDFRVRIAAANALRTLGDATYVDHLDRMAARELDGRGVRTAREAAYTLRKGPTTTDEFRRLRDDVAALRADNTKLRERLDRLDRESS